MLCGAGKGDGFRTGKAVTPAVLAAGDFLATGGRPPGATEISLLYRAADRARDRIRPRVSTHDFACGRRGEDLAHRHLLRHGFTIVARNYRPRGGGGEIDLIGWEGDRLAIVEVKTRGTLEFGPPDRAVHAEKQQRLARGAGEYCRRSGIPWEKVRFDIVNVVLDDPVTIELLRDAFRPGRTSTFAGTS